MAVTPFDLAGSVAKGQALGQQDRLRSSNNALTELLQQTPPTTPENRQALQGQAFTSGIDPQQSFQLVQNLSQMDTAQRAALKEKTGQAARLAFTIKGLPPEQRGPAFLDARKQMPDVFDHNVTDQESLDFALDSTINEGLTLSDLFKQAEGFTLGPNDTRFSGRGDVIATGTPPPPEGPKATDVAGLRKEFTAGSKNFVIAQQGLLKVNQAASGNTAQDDVALIFGFMKVVDPPSTVREGEFATAENTEGVSGRVRNLYNRLLTGERLNPEQRQNFVSAARRQFTPIKRAQERRVKFFKGIAQRNRMDPRDVIRDLTLAEPPAPDDGTAPLATTEAPTAKSFDEMTAEELGAVDVNKVPKEERDDLRRAFERMLSDG